MNIDNRTTPRGRSSIIQYDTMAILRPSFFGRIYLSTSNRREIALHVGVTYSHLAVLYYGERDTYRHINLNFNREILQLMEYIVYYIQR